MKYPMRNYLFELIRILLVTTVIVSCGTTGDGQVVKAGSANSEDNKSPLKGAIIKNDIDIEALEVKVKAAYLMTEDAQLKETNTAKLKERIFLTVELDTGWTKYNGKTFIGASEQILDQNGTVILDTQDLFADYDKEGLDASIAKNINLAAIIDSFEPGLETFTVKFKIWDKKGKGMVKGSYKFKIE
jgi:hypothetical protein